MLYPMFAMIVLTFGIGMFAVKVRFASVKTGEVNAKYYKLMDGASVPELVTKTTRCFNNQFEIPVLFYTVCTLYIALGAEDRVGLVSAWLFVFFRYIHAFVHLTYNHILHRMSVFWVAFICVMVLWVNLLVQQV
ncbi:hypothetical protein E4634_00205 [Mangrovimicrobium sediminis]|uniref:MAPEG family protein n=2 Tax=Mangrovimicrobium sediminis TaxID=2562682 RepID=A0A4Z0M8G7_9GAMM|nr:hypothetical protein E4634_00205 [Haliea sp. SAOS-164]